MTLRFVLTETERCLDYGPGATTSTPAVGDSVVADGTDVDFPAGCYEVTHVTHHVGLRGLYLTVCSLRWVYDLPAPASPRTEQTGENDG